MRKQCGISNQTNAVARVVELIFFRDQCQQNWITEIRRSIVETVKHIPIAFWETSDNETNKWASIGFPFIAHFDNNNTLNLYLIKKSVKLFFIMEALHAVNYSNNERIRPHRETYLERNAQRSGIWFERERARTFSNWIEFISIWEKRSARKAKCHLGTIENWMISKRVYSSELQKRRRSLSIGKDDKK